jgi:hypothetical protein
MCVKEASMKATELVNNKVAAQMVKGGTRLELDVNGLLMSRSELAESIQQGYLAVGVGLLPSRRSR